MKGLSDAKRARGQWWERPWSLVDFCTHVSPGCDHCWLAGLDHRLGKGGTGPDGRWSQPPRPRRDRLGLPQTVKQPTVWAVWSDLFHPEVPDEFIISALGRMAASQRHTYLVLTKRPKRAAEFCLMYGLVPWSSPAPGMFATPSGEQWPPNAWLGTSLEGPAQLARLDELLRCPAPVRWVNVGPWLEDLGLAPYLGRLSWVAAECESGPGRRHPPANAALRRLRDQCVSAGVPFWLKQWVINGRVVHAPKLDGRQWLQAPGEEAA